MSNDLRTQYDSFAEDFSSNQRDKSQINRQEMRRVIGDELSGMKVLDLACGDGIDADYYRDLGADVSGLDASEKLIEIAQSEYPEVNFVHGFAENMPFEDNSFDAVFSKYAIMTSADMQPIFNDVYRVLKSGGTFVYLVTHPLRQFIERKKLDADYFDQTVVSSNIYDATVSLREPSHTLNEYFNKDFFSKYEMVDFIEAWDPAAEQIYDGKFPGFFIVKAKKK